MAAAIDIPERNRRDARWLAAVAEGGRAGERAIAALFDEYRRPLFAFLLRHGTPASDVEDLVQEVFVRVARGAPAFRGDAAVSSWIYSIARNLCIDGARARPPEDQLDDEQWESLADTASCALGESASVAMQQCVQVRFTAFERADPIRGEALRRAALDGWSVRDVAAFLERSEAATREYLSQCRKKLREFLEPCRELLGGPG